MCPYLITKVCGINLGLKRRKSLNRRDCIKISVDKERSPPAPVGPSAPCYCLYVSPLITAPLDQVGWLTMGKRRAPTFLKSWTHTSTRTQARTHMHTLTTRKWKPQEIPPRWTTCDTFQGRLGFQKPNRWPPPASAWGERCCCYSTTSIIQAADAMRPQPPLHFNPIHTDTHTETSELWCFQQSGWD